MTCDGEEEVIVEWRELGKLVSHQLWSFGGSHTLFGDLVLHGLRQDLVWEFSQPRLEHRSDGIDVVKVGLIEEVDVMLSVETPLPMLDIFATARNSVQSLFFTTIHI